MELPEDACREVESHLEGVCKRRTHAATICRKSPCTEPSRRTARDSSIAVAHKASSPITIQCVGGGGTLRIGDAGEPVELTPGTLVTLEPNTVHEVIGRPAVSILVSHFVEK